MATYVLRDTVFDRAYSRTNNFNMEWMRWFGDAISLPFGSPIRDTDVVIYNVYEGDPFLKYDVPSKCKRIAIVHRLNTSNLPLIERATYAIYLNPFMQRAVTKIAGLRKPMKVCPHHPTKVDNGVVFNKTKVCYIGGWYKPSMDSLVDTISDIYTKLPLDVAITLSPVWSDYMNSDVVSFVDRLKISMTNNNDLNGRKFTVSMDRVPYDVFSFRVDTALMGCLLSDDMSLDEANDLMESSNTMLLDNGITESSMLSHMSSKSHNLIVDKRLNYITHVSEPTKFDYRDLSLMIREILSKFV